MDGGAWWAAVYGVAQSQTRLKWLSKGTYANRCLPGQMLLGPLSLQQATLDPHLCRRPSDIHRQVWLSLLWGHCSFPLGPSFHKVVFVSSKRLFSPVLWKFCNHILLAFKVRFPGDSPSLCWIPKLGSLIWGSGLSQQWETFFGIPVLQFVGCPSDRSRIGFYHFCTPPTVSSLSLEVGSSILLLMVLQQLVVILVLSQEEMNALQFSEVSHIWFHIIPS